MRALFVAALLALAVNAHAAEGPIQAAMRAEMRRTTARLKMAGLGKPYFLSYRVRDSADTSLSATFGALRAPYDARNRAAIVDLRLGGREFDQTHYVASGQWDYRPFSADMPLDDDVDALRYGLWSLTDKAYKNAAEKLAQKTAYKNAKHIADKIADLSQETVSSFPPQSSAVPAFDRTAWEGVIRRLSMVFRRYPLIQLSSVYINGASRTEYFIDSEGRAAVHPSDQYEIALEASAQGPDGLAIQDNRRFLRLNLAELPGEAELAAEAAHLAQELTNAAAAPVMEPYLGPVLFEGQAAAEFFNQLFVRNISSPRALWVEDEGAKKYWPSGGLAGRLGLRAVSPLLDIEDDPGLEKWEGIPLAGRYAVDDEAIPARKVILAREGMLQDVLMSRSPIKERKTSNGHGRAGGGEFTVGRPGNVIIRADQGASQEALEKDLRRRAGEFGLTYGMLITRLGDEDSLEDTDVLAEPIVAHKVYVADGRKEQVRGADFSGVTLRALRDIVAASKKSEVYNFYHLGPYRYSRSTVPASIVAPSVLISEMEMKKTDKKPTRPPYLPHPSFVR